MSFVNPGVFNGCTLVTIWWRQTNQSCAFEYADSRPKLEIY
jgi:hypothetical protein